MRRFRSAAEEMVGIETGRAHLMSKEIKMLSESLNDLSLSMTERKIDKPSAGYFDPLPSGFTLIAANNIAFI